MKQIRVRDRHIDHSGVAVGTRAINSLSAIDGISNISVESENDAEATLVYEWDPAAEPVVDIDDRLAMVNLRRTDWVEWPQDQP